MDESVINLMNCLAQSDSVGRVTDVADLEIPLHFLCWLQRPDEELFQRKDHQLMERHDYSGCQPVLLDWLRHVC